ncbi:AhpC/TSA family protein [Cellulophaga sp. F20128]|uniref:TlpA disulfide reductase family protein n=1 Tax=Cellulophaga sp. F20128 TaxID=2926413 RepID=UPI001FF3C12D|nr:TlpA disulfide reductase family protein [Cellulophaga sp. F20128]MCK0155672.1 AhpC/TSA family protein [Cellulophaga sp. F20128]
MKKITTFLLLLATLGLTAQHTISGTFTPAKDFTWLIVYQVKPGTQVYIADTKIEDGKFNLTLPEDTSPGTYRLVYAVPQEDFNFDVIYSGTEDIELHFNAQDKVTYTKSEENILLTKYFLEINAVQQQIIDFYTASNTNKNELANLYKKLASTQATYENDSKELLSNHFIKANAPYIAKTHESIYDFVENKKKNYFIHLDFNNPQLQASAFLTDKVLNYVFTSLPLHKITKSETENFLNQNIQTVAKNLKGVSEMFQFNLYYDLWIYAASAKYDITSDYIYSNYLKNLGISTNNQELIKGIEAHSRLREGAIAPEITWNNDKDSLSTLPASENYLLVFWSSGCSHCLTELPLLHQGLKSYKTVKVLAVGLEDDAVEWKQESAKLSDFTHALALGKWDSKYAEIYNISATPTYFILDKDKKIISSPENYEDVLSYFKK